MANFRTIVPGMQGGNDETSINQQPGSSPHDNRSASQDYQNDNSGTRVPGMEDNIPGRQNQSAGKPIVGFLASISRSEEGEYWVLRQGQNLIGSGSNCNVSLPEASVSGVHAVLAIHRNTTDNNKLSVGIIDKGSSNGTFVNENYIGFNPYQCKSFDKIKVGNYELLLILFDVTEFNLRKSEDFVPKGDYDYSDRDMYSRNDGTRF